MTHQTLLITILGHSFETITMARRRALVDVNHIVNHVSVMYFLWVVYLLDSDY